MSFVLSRYRRRSDVAYCGSIDIKSIEEAKECRGEKNVYSFTIIHPKRSFFLRANTQEECTNWIRGE